LGIRHDFDRGNTLMGSYVYSDIEDDFQPFPGFSVLAEETAHFVELRHLYSHISYDITAGAGLFDADVDELISGGPAPPVQEKSEIKHRNAYVYANVGALNNTKLTVGLSVDSFESEPVDRDQWNPKLGITTQLGPDTTLRAAAFRTFKRTLVSSQTLEPTQVAGFNQFFDDTNATDTRRYGVGIDHNITINGFGGVEFSRRDLDVPIRLTSPSGGTEEVDWKEQFARAYLYWTIYNWLALSIEYQYEKLERDAEGRNPGAFSESRTHKLPLEVRLFHPSRVFATARATYIDQEGIFVDAATDSLLPGQDDFWVVDAALGYRLPRRYGLVFIEVRNLLDEEFRFQDSDPTNSLIARERAVFAKAKLAF
jgi:outer membrane receptor protein involved in Fe transport